ncbi:protein kinase domain-containing protein [Sphaerisporangium flaviroseum]|uniref:protein kinase domain-containing protein n=1 Tax=Sphaerisporangium flaviroseum TaxID=509199 RepID=UPI0031F0EF50
MTVATGKTPAPEEAQPGGKPEAPAGAVPSEKAQAAESSAEPTGSAAPATSVPSTSEAPTEPTASSAASGSAGAPAAPAGPVVSPGPSASPDEAERDRRFVVKLLPPWPEADSVARARVVDELSAAQRVSSAYAVRAVDAGWTGDRAYVVREYVEGRSLREAVETDGPLPADVLERIAVGTLTALTAVHLAGIAHRGLTPDNVLLDPDGPRVSDFGLGETAYRSPEQVRGEPAGPAADVFAWATTIAYGATGDELFGDSAEAIATARPDLGALSLPLRDVVASCLAKMPAERPTAQGAMLWLLGEEKAGPPAPAIPAAPVPGAPQVPAGPSLINVSGPSAPSTAAVPRRPEGEEPAPVWAVPTQQAPSAPVWTAPVLPSEVPELPAPPAASRNGLTPATLPRKKTGPNFPIGLVAGVGVVIGLSGLGLWGAGHYSGTQQIGRVAAEGQVTGVPMPSGGLGNVGGVGESTAPRPQVTVPWASSPDPQDTGVYPMRLTTATPSIGIPTLSPGPQFTPPPIPTPVPTPTVSRTQSPTPAPTVTVTKTPEPTVTPTAEPTPTPSGPSQTPVPSGGGTPTPEATPSGTPTPSPSGPQNLVPSATPTPTPTATAPVSPRPTVTRTATPRPTRTASSTPRPTVTRPIVPRPTGTTSKPPVSSPYTPQTVCGGGFSVVRSSPFNGGVTYQLYNGATASTCVVTMKTQYLGIATPVSATLEVQGSAPVSNSGSFKYYAGPVIMASKGKCVRFGGSTATGSTSVPFTCG